MRIPVFVSCPTSLGVHQAASRTIIIRELERCGLEPRALGRSDYPTELPLREVLLIARHCAGGVILGFSQLSVNEGRTKVGTPDEKPTPKGLQVPTPWNHLEAGVLLGAGLPLLVFREPGVSGGVFDAGVTDVFVHQTPAPPLTKADKDGLRSVFMKWQAEVRRHYYGE